MKQWKGVVVLGMVLLLAGVGNPTSARAAKLQIVFENSLWGAAIGCVTGIAYWGLQEEDTSEIPTLSLRGAAIGVFGGMLFGFYEVKSGDAVFGKHTPEEHGLLHYDSFSQTLILSPARLFVSTQNHSSSKNLKSTLFSATF
ncbi:hypothetical protein WDW89_01245 [Deltaproteobacteria bacterium TL4]